MKKNRYLTFDLRNKGNITTQYMGYIKARDMEDAVDKLLDERVAAGCVDFDMDDIEVADTRYNQQAMIRIDGKKAYFIEADYKYGEANEVWELA